MIQGQVIRREELVSGNDLILSHMFISVRTIPPVATIPDTTIPQARRYRYPIPIPHVAMRDVITRLWDRHMTSQRSIASLVYCVTTMCLMFFF